MRNWIFGLTALLAFGLTGPAWSQAEPDGFQEDEQPGSEFELDIDSGGKVEFGRAGKLEAEAEGEAPAGKAEPNPLQIGEDDPLGDDPLDDPDNPVDPDPIDEELPGEGPEDLSGPDDDDPLPY